MPKQSETTVPPPIEMHPVQIRRGTPGTSPTITSAVTRRAYEVYCECFSPQEAIVTGGCRGGFGVGELVAFLYARSFPKSEWQARVDEAFRGMKDFGA